MNNSNLNTIDEEHLFQLPMLRKNFLTIVILQCRSCIYHWVSFKTEQDKIADNPHYSHNPNDQYTNVCPVPHLILAETR